MRLRFLAVLCTLLPTAELQAQAKPLYQQDGRMEITDASPQICQSGTAVLAIVSSDQLSPHPASGYRLKHGPTLNEMGWCDTERFSQQPTGVFCTAFLLAPDVAATAGHCINAADDPYGDGLNCAQLKLLLDHRLSRNGVPKSLFAERQVVGCRAVLDGFTSPTGADWRVIRLDRPVDRTPLALWHSPVIPDNAAIIVVGHAQGLPMKASLDGTLRDTGHSQWLLAELDAYQGSSGSPVMIMDKQTPKVIGVLSTGERDSPGSIRSGECLSSLTCQGSACRGERVTRSQSLMAWISPNGTAVSGALESHCQ